MVPSENITKALIENNILSIITYNTEPETNHGYTTIIKYSNNNRELQLYRDANGLSGAKMLNTYHQLTMDFYTHLRFLR